MILSKMDRSDYLSILICTTICIDNDECLFISCQHIQNKHYYVCQYLHETCFLVGDKKIHFPDHDHFSEHRLFQE